MRPPRWRSQSAFAGALYLPIRSRARSCRRPFPDNALLDSDCHEFAYLRGRRRHDVEVAGVVGQVVAVALDLKEEGDARVAVPALARIVELRLGPQRVT